MFFRLQNPVWPPEEPTVLRIADMSMFHLVG